MKARAVYGNFTIIPNNEEWLCAHDTGDGWEIPDTQCGGYYPLNEDWVICSVDLPEVS